MTKAHPVGNEIKEFRMKRGWTQAYTAMQFKISLRTIVALEVGSERKPRPLTLAKIHLAMQSIEKAA